MTTARLFVARGLLAGLTVGAMLLLSSPAKAQPDEELIDKLLQLSKDKKKVEPGKDDDELRKLLVRRYNVAIDELKLRCEEFKKSVATQPMVVEAGKHLLQADLEMQTKTEDKVKVLERAIDLMRWYENRMERAVKGGLVGRADLLRVEYTRLTMEIDLVKLKRGAGAAEK